MNFDISVVVLTGGTSRRFGSDKSSAILNGRSLLNHVLDPIGAHLSTFIVGEAPFDINRSVTVVREEPALGGPVSAIAAALPLVTSARVFLIATDMPFVSLLLPVLESSWKSNFDAVVPLLDNQSQPLCALFDRVKLSIAISKLGATTNTSMRELMSHLNPYLLPLSPELSHCLMDIDYPADLILAAQLSDTLNQDSNSSEEPK